jgi:hypothetical protein
MLIKILKSYRMINNDENVKRPYFLLYSIHTFHLQVLKLGSL